MSLPATFCELHSSHRPTARTFEYHHIIPRAWQEFWHPTPLEAIYLESSGLTVWDPRTMPLAPTCHRNVHFWIVAYMKQDDPIPARPRGEQAVAMQALTRWEEAGGSLDALRAAKMWGEA